MEEIKEENKRKSFKEIWNKKITKEDIKNFFFSKGLLIYLIINISYIFAGSYLRTINELFFSDYSRGYIFLMFINVIVIIIHLIKNKYEKNGAHICVLFIFVFALIATMFARIQRVALLGFQDRYEGLFSIAYYLTLMILSSFLDKKHKKIIVNCIIFTGVIQAVYALLQTYKLPWISNSHPGAAQGFITNPNFFGTFMVLCSCFSIGLFIDEEKISRKIIYIFTSVILMIGLLISNTASAGVALVFVLIYILVYCIKKKKIAKLIATIAIISISTIITLNLGKTNMLKDLTQTAKEATEVAKGNADDKFGSSRMFIWKNTLPIIPKYLLHGAGIDNFYFAFGEEPLQTDDGKTIFDKAHNEYLQTLVTQGIFSLISYLALYALILKKGIKYSFKENEIYLILPIIGYLTQAFFNISVIEVAPIFYISIGLCSSIALKKE
ncbi:MAG: O-antigen ligase family protein [Clostridia bacterium]|nr:O-antigen ligase family protein [Clostridia bacterium]